MTPNDVGCFILQTIFDTIPGQVQPALADNLALYMSFANAVITPFFSDFDCNLDGFTDPGPSAGESLDPSQSNTGPIIINGVYQ